MSDLIAPFRALYADRHAAASAWKARTGGKVVGYVGADVPEEMILAAGMLPVRVIGDPRGSIAAVEPYVEATADPGVKSIAARLMDGTYAYIDHLVISVTPSIYGALQNFFVELRRLNPEMTLPEPHLFDFFHSRYRTTSLFDRESLVLFRKTLGGWSGAEITDPALAAAIAKCNESRRLLADVAALRAPGAPMLSGADALQIVGTAFTTPKDEHAGRLKALLAGAAGLSEQAGLPVIYSGSETETLDAYEAIESAGGVIVADDQEWGSRAAEILVDENLSPMDGICDRYQFRSPQAAGRTVKDRRSYLAALAERTGARAVVFHILAIDHPSAWDYPRLRDHLRSKGLATVELGPRRYDGSDAAIITERVAEFVADQSSTVAA